MTNREQEFRAKAIKAAMAELVLDSRFGRFIDVLRDQREAVIEDFCTDRVTADPLLKAAATGELRTYQAIIATYDNYVSLAAERASEQAQP